MFVLRLFPLWFRDVAACSVGPPILSRTRLVADQPPQVAMPASNSTMRVWLNWVTQRRESLTVTH